jgi:hypothetical protein
MAMVPMAKQNQNLRDCLTFLPPPVLHAGKTLNRRHPIATAGISSRRHF